MERVEIGCDVLLIVPTVQVSDTTNDATKTTAGIQNKIWQASRLTAAMIVRIKENSWLAKLSAKKLGSKKVAVVVGKTIHLFNTSREEFLKDEKWVCHELAHVQQYEKYGLVKFLALYLFESIKKGYRMNRYELEAKSKERNPEIMLDYVIA